MKAKTIIHSILEENAIKAKKAIAEDLAIKLGQRLAEEYVRVAKTTFNEADDNLANNYPPFDKVTRGDIIWYEPEDVEGGTNTDEEGDEDKDKDMEGDEDEGCEEGEE